MNRKPVSERLLRAVYAAASRIFYRSSAHADWMWERMHRPSTCLALALNFMCYGLRLPRIFRVVTVMVEPVFGCNLRCKTCWGVLDLEGRRPHLMDWELFCKFVDGIPKSVESIVFSLMGEPLLHPRLHEMIDYAADKGLRTILFTNGTLLEGENVRRIAASQLSVLNVSIEADPKNAQEMRGIDLEVIRAHIKTFLAAKRPETELKLSIVAHPGNLSRIATIHRDWREFAEHIKVSPQLGVADAPGPPPLCLEPWRGNLNFYTNGDVSPCCCDWYTELCIGNLHQQSLPEIIHGAAYRGLLRGFLNGNVPNLCLTCKEFTVDGAPLRLRKRIRPPKP